VSKTSMRHRLYVDLIFDRPITRTQAKYHAKHALTNLPAIPGHPRHNEGPIPNVCVEDIILIKRTSKGEQSD
jgi:hypothetical protein